MNRYQQLQALAANLWWTWQPTVISVFRDLDPELWRQANHNPIVFLSRIPPERVEERARDLALDVRIHQAFHRLHSYLEEQQTWGRLVGGIFHANPVAYFSAEFGLHESLPIYSGGLGILAGDHLKAASDLGIPVVGVGLFYAQGYFNQRIDASGRQHESYAETEIDKLPLRRLQDDQGHPQLVEVQLRDRRILGAMWCADVGRNRLLLLDSDVADNAPEDRQLTSRLYGGDQTTRIRQELLLGVGGMRALTRLAIDPSVLHLNEGHSAFATLEWMRLEMERDGIDFAEARRRVAYRTVFTTHTPVPAGHDRFNPELAEQTLGPLRDALGLSPHDFFALGRVHPEDAQEPFGMTTLALRTSSKANAVSAMHERVSKRMWRSLWPQRAEWELPISHVTNGVHVSSWIAPPIYDLYTEILGRNWEQCACRPETWTAIQQLEDGQLWEAHQMVKTRLLRYLLRQVETQESRRQGDPNLSQDVQRRFHPDVLTIAFARRFASYKRAALILADESRLARLIDHPEHPIQFVFAGKAHPQNEPGKDLIQHLVQVSRRDPFRGRLLFLEDYDISVARHLVQGADLWLNTPRRPHEACGTSGMKAIFNMVLNCSILDGWWAEAYDGSNGFAIGHGGEHAQTEEQDRLDARDLYALLEQQVLPAYYERDDRGVPRRWIQLIKNAISRLAWRFNSQRMLIDYALQSYLPCAGGALTGFDGLSPSRPTPRPLVR